MPSSHPTGSPDVSEWLIADRKKYELTDQSVRTYGQNLGVVFELALKFRWVTENPVRAVPLPKRYKFSSHRPFTDQELVDTYFAGDEEWQEMILCGSATGMRIGDVSLCVVGDIDFATGFLRPMARKVRLIEAKPVPTWLLNRWKKKFEGLPATTPLFPRAYQSMFIKARDGSGKVRVNSTVVVAQFKELLVRAGHRVADEKVRGVERVGANKYLPLTFGCLRHTYTTLLKISCVSEAVARAIIGHRSQAISEIYTHIDEAAAKAAVEEVHNPLGDLLTPKDDQTYLFDDGTLPLGSWVMRFSRGKNPWDGAIALPLEPGRTARKAKFFYIQGGDQAESSQN
jgi:integrase